MELTYNDKLRIYYQKNKQILLAKPTGRREVLIASELAKALNCRTEVQAPLGIGRIDCLSHKILIEVKYADLVLPAKAALGQLLLYKYALKFKGQLAIGNISEKGYMPAGIEAFCHEANIIIFIYHLNECRWRCRWQPKV